MTLANAFEPIEQINKNIVMSNTWGHLFPQKKYYEGHITIARGVYSEIIILEEDIDIEGSPWWYEATYDFINELTWDVEAGEIFKIDIAVSIDEEQQICINELRRNQIMI